MDKQVLCDMQSRFIHKNTFAPLPAPVVQLVSFDFFRQDNKVVNLPFLVRGPQWRVLVVRIHLPGRGLRNLAPYTVSIVRDPTRSNMGTPKLLTIGVTIEIGPAEPSRQEAARHVRCELGLLLIYGALELPLQEKVRWVALTSC